MAARFVFPHASDDAVGEVSLVGSPGFASGLPLAEFALDVGSRVWPVSVLDDAGDVEHAVDATVAAVVESMAAAVPGCRRLRAEGKPDLRRVADP